MSQYETKKPVKNEVLDDKELEGVSGGGGFYSVSSCIKNPPVTKLVWWFLSGVDYSACKECPLLDQLSTGTHCRQIDGNMKWEG